ncbi:MAG: PD-(D/E)XK nuclease family protein [Dehalococcoidales bacterium]|nr:PD-(D/E)XK nuclease family protein [Dehalococcoidales bacterium]
MRLADTVEWQRVYNKAKRGEKNMPVYSHSRLSVYQNCPLKYKLQYHDKIKRYVEGVEAFLGSRAHDVLKKAYDDVRLTKQDSLADLLAYYDEVWQGKWHDSIVITRQEFTQDHYYNLGKKFIETYYQRYAPFDSDRTIATELRLNFPLDGDGKYRIMGFVDRLSRNKDGCFEIHDYKTSANLPSQEVADSDRQLALYQIGVQKRWPDMWNMRLVWHYLAFGKELVSSHSDETISGLVEETTRLIDTIEATQEFLPKESGLCNWCEYPDLCPTRKHLYTVEVLPENEYLNETGVSLVNKYAKLKKEVGEIEAEAARIREAIIDYARREDVQVIKGSEQQLRIRFDTQLKFPGKNESGRKQLDDSIMAAGKWPEVSQLDTRSLSRVIEDGLWNKELLEELKKYGQVEETSSVFLSKLKDEE